MGKPAPPRPARPEIFDLLDDLLGSHGGKYLLQGLIAPLGQILVDAGGVDDAAAAQGDAGLGGQEGGILVLNGQAIQPAQVAGAQGVDDRLRVLGAHMDQTADQLLLLVPDIHDGLQEAHADTAGDAQSDVLAGLKQSLKLVVHLAGAGGDAAAALAYDDLHHTALPSFRW